MKVFDLKAMQAADYAERGKNVFYSTPEFKTRIIELPAGGTMPQCEMASHVVFVVVDGTAIVTVNQQDAPLKTGQCLITEPATISMKTENGVKIMGIQIQK
ncbi:MAG: hypothetical protein ACP5FZ_10595 [Fidelibacterota bacterium]